MKCQDLFFSERGNVKWVTHDTKKVFLIANEIILVRQKGLSYKDFYLHKDLNFTMLPLIIHFLKMREMIAEKW